MSRWLGAPRTSHLLNNRHHSTATIFHSISEPHIPGKMKLDVHRENKETTNLIREGAAYSQDVSTAGIWDMGSNNGGGRTTKEGIILGTRNREYLLFMLGSGCLVLDAWCLVLGAGC